MEPQCVSFKVYRFPEYHERFYATFFVDLHGFMLETVTYEQAQIVEA